MICTSALKKFKWQYMIADEAHKLKNKDSKISMVSRTMNTRNRLLLTGTPLQNNLLELWALLNFMMPEVFSSDDDFKLWFDFGEDGKPSGAEADAEQNNKNLSIIEGLHKILRPFLLRRTKADLATKLPDKIEMIVNTSMSSMQFDIYEKLLKSQSIFTEKSKSNARQLNNLLMQVSCLNLIEIPESNIFLSSLPYHYYVSFVKHATIRTCSTVLSPTVQTSSVSI